MPMSTASVRLLNKIEVYVLFETVVFDLYSEEDL